jgi:hypothetical protein
MLNDPSVTKTFNSITGRYQYTMFYTLDGSDPTNGNVGENQIWSSVSDDGITWNYHQPLLQGPNAYTTPSAVVVDNTSTGVFWNVYYSDGVEDTTKPMYF